MVQEKSNGHLHLVDPGTGAVLHGLMSMLSEVLDGLDRRLDAMESRLAEVAERPLPEPPAPPPPPPELDTEPIHAAIDAAAARVTEHLAAQLAEQVGGLAGELTDADERVGRIEQAVVEAIATQVDERLAAVESAMAERVAHVESALAERMSGLDDAVSDRTIDLMRRLAQVEASVAEGRAEATQVAPRVEERLARFEEAVEKRLARFDQTHQTIADRVTDRIASADDAAADRAVDLIRRIGQVEAALTESRADTAELAAMAPRLDQVAGQLAERISEAEQVATGRAEQFEARISMQLAELDAAVAAMRAESAALPSNLSEQMQAAIGSWRNRLRRGESDENIKKAFDDLSAQLADGVSRLQDAVNRAQGESLSAAQTTVAEIRRLLDSGQSEHLDAVAALAEKLVAIHDELARHDSRLVDAVIAAIPEPPAPPTPLPAPEPIVVDTTETIDALRAWIADELTRMREALEEAYARTGTVATSVARQVDDVVQAAVTAVNDRVGRERTATDGIRRDVELLGTRIEELGKSVSAGRREFAITSQGLPDLLRNVIQENDLGPAIEAVKDAVASANHEHQDVLRALHSSLAKRFDLRARTIAETLDGLAASLEAAKTIGPSLDKVGARLEQQQPFLDQMRTELMQIGTAVGAMPADMERRHAEATAGIDRVADALTTLRKHAAALDRAVQGMRASQDGLATAFIDLRDGNGVLPQRLDQIGTAIDLTRRQLGEVAELTRTVATSVDQQQAMGNRLAELVTQVRAATRSDIERVESSIHLEVLKQHQQDQARLTQAVAGVSEVVEREAGVIAQRVSALATEVDAIRLELAGTRPDASN